MLPAPLPVDEIASIGARVAAALHDLHRQNVIHLDIKPSNLLVDERGKVWVADFGLARMQTDLGVTATGTTLAEAQTAAYAAVDAIDWPEGFCRRDIGWRAL